jgi:hypothetical protein
VVYPKNAFLYQTSCKTHYTAKKVAKSFVKPFIKIIKLITICTTTPIGTVYYFFAYNIVLMNLYSPNALGSLKKVRPGVSMVDLSKFIPKMKASYLFFGMIN